MFGMLLSVNIYLFFPTKLMYIWVQSEEAVGKVLELSKAFGATRTELSEIKAKALRYEREATSEKQSRAAAEEALEAISQRFSAAENEVSI